ncbi:hypothetical protein HWV62_37649 [Athelia sp. TMB]|nr:hypothetical protein HWV62_37649 [Athelia sp. TMB]
MAAMSTSLRRTPSLESIASSALSYPEDESEGPDPSVHAESTEVSLSDNSTRIAYPKHGLYSFACDTIHLLVEGVLYSVHRYFFERDSSTFDGKGLTEEEPMILHDVSAHDFDLFLAILYPTDFGVYTATTVNDWTAILSLAESWSFKSIRALAIKQLNTIASVIDKIVLGRQYGIDHWLHNAYSVLCARPAALNMEEGRRLGVDDVVRISTLRQELGVGLRRPKCTLEDFRQEISLRFEVSLGESTSSSPKAPEVHEAPSTGRDSAQKSSGADATLSSSAANTAHISAALSNNAQQLMSYAYTPSAELITRGVPSHIVHFVDANRTNLQRYLHQQLSARGMAPKYGSPIDPSRFMSHNQPMQPSTNPPPPFIFPSVVTQPVSGTNIELSVSSSRSHAASQPIAPPAETSSHGCFADQLQSPASGASKVNIASPVTTHQPAAPTTGTPAAQTRTLSDTPLVSPSIPPSVFQPTATSKIIPSSLAHPVEPPSPAFPLPGVNSGSAWSTYHERLLAPKTERASAPPTPKSDEKPACMGSTPGQPRKAFVRVCQSGCSHVCSNPSCQKHANECGERWVPACGRA